MNRFLMAALASGAALMLGCGTPASRVTDAAPSLAASREARPAVLAMCESLAQTPLSHTKLTASTRVALGALSATGIVTPMPEHCLVRGRMHERVSAVDGKSYAIGFEMRLPTHWNGRFFYQANGGIDGNIVPAIGSIGGGGPTTSALQMGFATLSSDAGHPAPNPFFGLDPQARRDYGYAAVQSLTPMAKQLIASAYGKQPDRSYIGGCSNGGRHAMVAAERMGDQYDGVLAGNPGFRLPLAAVAQLDKAQAYASVSDKNTAGLPDLQTAMRPDEYQLVARQVLARCDALDGVTDAMVHAPRACQAAFDLQRDVPTCTSQARSSQCLSAERKAVLTRVFSGPKHPSGEPIYHPFWFDPGVASNSWRFWHFTASQNLDPGAVAFIFTTPPSSTASYFAAPGLRYALAADLPALARATSARTGVYTESAMDFMGLPAGNIDRLTARGGKVMVFHGTGDGVFSAADTVRWYDALAQSKGAALQQSARLFMVPAMGHCSAGPSTDQFNMLQSLVAWVEQGIAPDQVIAKVRGVGSALPNPEVPHSWSPTRSRPLCPHPLVARYKQVGSIEDAQSFACAAP